MKYFVRVFLSLFFAVFACMTVFSDQADRLLTHPFWGLLIFFVSMYFVFGLTFILGDYPVRWLESGQEALGDWCNQLWANNPDSLLRSLIVDGVIAGVGGVLVFLPNILILFAAIAILEEWGYMARGAFLTDRKSNTCEMTACTD